MTARIIEVKHEARGSDLKPLVILPRALEIRFRHPALRPNLQQRLDGYPGTSGSLCDDLNGAGILVEDRALDHFDRAACEDRQRQHRLFEVLSARRPVNLGL